MPWLSRRKRETEAEREVSQIEVTAAVRGSTVYLGLGGEQGPVQVPPDWAAGQDWLDWDPPINAVHGESHYQDALRAIAGGTGSHLVPVVAALVREPTNPYDSNAIRVEVEGLLCGHVSRELAAELAPSLDAQGAPTLRVPAVVRGGSPRAPTLGVHLWLDRRIGPNPNIALPSASWVHLSVPWPPFEMADEPAGGDHDTLYELNKKIEKAWSDRDCERCVSLVHGALPRLDAMAEPRLNDSGQVKEEDIRGFLTAGELMAALGDRTGLIAVWEAFRQSRYLASFSPRLHDLLDAETQCTAILRYVDEHPGAIQKDLYQAVGLDKQRVQWLCYLAEVVGRLSREKSGVSYALRLL